MLKFVLGEKGTEVVALLEAIKARGQQIEAVEYDSDDEREKSPQKKLLAATDRGSRARVVT